MKNKTLITTLLLVNSEHLSLNSAVLLSEEICKKCEEDPNAQISIFVSQ